MKRIVLLLLVLLMSLSLIACTASYSKPIATTPPAETPYVPRHEYVKPEVADGETLLWYGDGQYSAYQPPRYAIVGFPDDYLEHTDKTYTFDDGPEGTRNYAYFSSLLTGKAPVKDAQIVILSSDDNLPWEAKSLVAILYDVSVDDLLRVTLGEPRLCSNTSVYFEWTADSDMLPLQARDNYASEEGGFHLSDSFIDGTPYSQMGIIYDKSMLYMEKGGEYSSEHDDQAAGSGSTNYRWTFSPLVPGESDILILTNSYTEGISGVMVHVTVDEELNWSLNWYAEGNISEDFHIYVTVENAKYSLDNIIWA